MSSDAAFLSFLSNSGNSARRSYSESVKRILRTGVTSEEVDLLAFAAAKQEEIEEKDALRISVTEEDEENARSAVERFLHRHFESLSATKGLFELNDKLEVSFGANPCLEFAHVKTFIFRSSVCGKTLL